MKLTALIGVALAFAAANVVPASADYPPPGYNPGYGQGSIDQFHYYENIMVQWNQRYAAAPSGSWDEQQADQQRRQAGQAALNAILQFNALAGYPSPTLEAFAQELGQKYGAAPSGSYPESVYRSAMDPAWSAYSAAAIGELRQGSPTDYLRPIQLGEAATQKYGAAPSGSRSESAYRQVMAESWNVAREFLRNYFSYNNQQDFREYENLGVSFTQQYAAAPSGSLRESFYRDAMVQAFDAAVARFQQMRMSFDRNSLYAIQQEYNQRFSAAPSGSRLEAYCRPIRDLAREAISGTTPYPPAPPQPYPPQPQPPYPPQPYPPAPPQPYPPQPQVRCTLDTGSTVYSGVGPNIAIATDNTRRQCAASNSVPSECWSFPVRCD